MLTLMLMLQAPTIPKFTCLTALGPPRRMVWLPMFISSTPLMIYLMMIMTILLLSLELHDSTPLLTASYKLYTNTSYKLYKLYTNASYKLYTSFGMTLCPNVFMTHCSTLMPPLVACLTFYFPSPLVACMSYLLPPAVASRCMMLILTQSLPFSVALLCKYVVVVSCPSW